MVDAVIIERNRPPFAFPVDILIGQVCARNCFHKVDPRCGTIQTRHVGRARGAHCHRHNDDDIRVHALD